MKTFLLDIIPRIQHYSQKIDNLTVLTNKNWVVVDEELNRKVVFIFREKENQLLISENGKIEKGSWEYLGNNSLLIDRKDGSYLFKHGFFDDTVLALKVDGKEEYALLVNEHKFDKLLNSLSSILKYLNLTYSDEMQKRILTIPETKVENSSIKENEEKLNNIDAVYFNDLEEKKRKLEEAKNMAKEVNKDLIKIFYGFIFVVLISLMSDKKLI